MRAIHIHMALCAFRDFADANAGRVSSIPSVIPELIITVAGLAIFISVGSLLIMALPTDRIL